MGSAEQVTLRQRFCRAQACGAVFYLCRPCDRGQRYCSEQCRDKSRREQRRAANRRHQCSPEGRLDHRDRQREYRQRLLARCVTDQSSGTRVDFPSLWPLDSRLRDRCRSVVFCRVCGRQGTLIDPFTG
jgi:hypothetical protein